MRLSPELLVAAYRQGVFPMADDEDNILWFDPDPRAILPLDEFHVSRSLRKIVRQGRFEILFDSAFTKVIYACADPAPGRELTWINSDIIDGYIRLSKLGIAHSVETWISGELVGGLYGVAINGLFAGESMFSRSKDASKIALLFLVEHLRRRQYLLLDIQFITNHLKQFGAIEIPRSEYRYRLAAALSTPTTFYGP